MSEESYTARAVKTLQAERVREHLEAMLRYFARNIVRDLDADMPDGYQGHLDVEIKRLLDDMFDVCPPEAWELIGRPVMDRRTAEQLQKFEMAQAFMQPMTMPVQIPQATKEMLAEAERQLREVTGIDNPELGKPPPT